MKKFQEPPFKQNAIALGFTLGVHAIAIVGLLFLGLSKPPEQPKKLTTVLIKPEDLPPPMAKPVEQETTAENQAEEILSPVVDNTQPENLPITPPTPTAQQLADAKQKTEQQQVKLAEQKKKVEEETAQAKQAEERQKQAEAQAQKQRADEEVKRKIEQAAKDKAAADKAAKDKAAADKASKDKAAADKAAKDKAAADKAARDKAAADKAAKDKAAADKASKDKAAADKASKDKAAADKAARDKAAADKASKDKADAERAEADAKAAAAKKAEQEAAQKKADAKKVASTAIQDFRRKIDRAWHVPQGTSGKKVTVRFTLSDSGAVLSKVITKSSGDDALDASILAAIDAAAPYPMPDDPDARREARTASPTFIAK